MNRTLPNLAAAILLLGAAGSALAQNWSVKAGITRYDTHSVSNGVNGIGVPPGADAIVGDATTAIFVIERALTENVSAELVLGVPPRIKARGAGSVAFLGDDVLSAKNIAPTLLFNYQFGSPGDRLRPYVGLGMNYTRFSGVRSKLAPEVHMGDSTGPVVQIGLNVALTKTLGLYASIARVEVSTDVVAIGSTVLTSHIDFRPRTYSLGMIYRF